MRSLRRRVVLGQIAMASTMLLLTTASASPAIVAAAPRPFQVAANGEYLIQFQPGAAQREAAVSELTADGHVLEHVATNVPIEATTLTPAQARVVATSPGVVAIWPNLQRHTEGTEANPPWGLDRIDQADLPLAAAYDYSSTGGAGTTIYIIDSGINPDHVEFTDRIAPGASAINDGWGTADCDGHGTHVAGISAGTQFGVAKLATLVPVRVLDCSGSGSDAEVIAGIDWVISRHTTGRAVANMSLGGGPSPIIDAAIEALVADGVAVALAAGNSNADACNFSPAAAPSPLTVGATTPSDSRPSFSNWGPCVDLFAPGTEIISAYIGSATATATLNGTSMASPHVAGVLAALWTDHPLLSALEVQQLLIDTATTNRLTNIGPGSPNLLLYGGGDPAATPPPPAPAPAPQALRGGPASAGEPARRCRMRTGC